ncbi:TonB-dependent siderophore receptor [Pseudomonas gingeri]|nr:TonB-dependent siderophore receptor [Pseudomonas gingeri]NWA13106.1 TonB-dependent siderophore receptor [Pseudomonas gingeri]NWA55367.1 TonB-dependent siderophore receptor [Pseudomonas gingeri]NWA95779.1 TonB-dependent siderophore receptor [Pseudomonas gingeri]NWB00867.1 TonB-dependent siderophore receptor [Pseudomonas gingeri]
MSRSKLERFAHVPSPCRLTFNRLLFAPLALAAAVAQAQSAPETVLPQTQILGDQATQNVAVTEGTDSYKPALVTVGKVPVQPKDLPGSVSVITRQRMDDQAMTTVDDALRNTPGITAVTYGDGTSYFQSRGYAAEVQFDGLPANNGLQYLPQFDLAMYDRVEVLRGPAGLLQGFGNPGGTVNLVRKRPQDVFGLSGAVSAGSWDSYRTEWDVTGPLNDSGTIKGRLGFSGRDERSFQDDGKTGQGLIYGSLAFDLDPDTELTVGMAQQKINLNGVDYGLSTFTNGRFVDSKRSGFYGTDWSYADTDMTEIYADLVHRFGNGWQNRTAINYRTSEVSSKYGYIDGQVNPDRSADYWLQRQQDRYRWVGVDSYVNGPFELFGRTHELMLGVNYAESHQHSLSGGTSGGVVDIDNINVPNTDIPYSFGTTSDTRQYGVYGQVTFKPVDDLSLILGGRQNHYESSRQNLLPSNGATVDDPDQNKFTPYAGVVYGVNSWLSAYASYSDIFTPSQAFQTTASGSVLKPRTGHQAEVGLKSDFLDGRLGASLAVFQIDDQNRPVADDANPGRWLAQGKARSSGFEAQVTGKVLPNWDVQAGYTYLQTRLLGAAASDGSIQDPEEPKHMLKLWNTYHFEGDTLNNWRVGGGVRAQSRTTRNEVSYQGGYAVVDGLIGYKIDEHLDLALNMNNLLDRTYYARVPSNYYGLYGDPRNATLTLRVKY